MLRDRAPRFVQQLSELTGLDVLYIPVGQVDAPQARMLLRSLAKVSSLQQLRLNAAALFPHAWEALLPLTALQSLTKLHCVAASRVLELTNQVSCLFIRLQCVCLSVLMCVCVCTWLWNVITKMLALFHQQCCLPAAVCLC